VTAVSWVDTFVALAHHAGIEAQVAHRVRGWPETILVAGHRCFSKSMTYLSSKNEYFLGVDPKKLDDSGDYVVLCGAHRGSLADIFVAPWHAFFELVRGGTPVNTYRAPRRYLQYKLHLRMRGDGWELLIQGHALPQRVDHWHLAPDDALVALSTSAQA